MHIVLILLFIVYLIDNINADRNHRYLHHYTPQFRAPHSPPYHHIYIPGTFRFFSLEIEPFIVGDILLGGFFPIHQPPSYELGSLQCTAIKRERGIQRLEAMLFALDVVNSRSSNLMKSKLAKIDIRFGALIYDSCDYESYAVERALNMLLPSVKQCSPVNELKQSSVVAGVIGSASSIVSMAIADILRLAEVISSLSFVSSTECHFNQINGFFFLLILLRTTVLP